MAHSKIKPPAASTGLESLIIFHLLETQLQEHASTAFFVSEGCVCVCVPESVTSKQQAQQRPSQAVHDSLCGCETDHQSLFVSRTYHHALLCGNIRAEGCD